MTHPTDEELEEQFSDEIEVALDPMGAWKLITYLRAQLAEARTERDVWEIDAKRNHQAAEIEFARADRAEAALAAQIEDACAVIDAHSEYDQSFCCDGRECGCQGASVHDMMKHFIRQPRDRTALDRIIADTQAKALRKAADRTLGLATGHECRQAILTMIEETPK